LLLGVIDVHHAARRVPPAVHHPRSRPCSLDAHRLFDEGFFFSRHTALLVSMLA